MTSKTSGSLYIVATPIGNLEDITLRAIRVLKEIDLILAEDTRQTKKLLDKYQIKTPITSYHKWNIKEKTEHFINKLRFGQKIALVSDAGMPGISDPGYELVKAAIENDIIVIPIPGPSASITALSISGLPTDRFSFEGFLPAKKGERVEVLNKLKNEEATLLFFEAPHRLMEALEDMLEAIGDRKIVIARELTKKFEEHIRGSISEILQKLSSKKIKGEIVVVMQGAGRDIEKGIGEGIRMEDEKKVLALINDLLASGVSKKDVVKLLKKHFNISRNYLYKILIQ